MIASTFLRGLAWVLLVGVALGGVAMAALVFSGLEAVVMAAALIVSAALFLST